MLLTPFDPIDISVSVTLNVDVETQILSVCFDVVNNTQDDLVWPKDSVSLGGRADELWCTTCCELFILPNPERSKYYEINLSPWGLWNSYVFEDIRYPQPPTITPLIELVSMNMTNTGLTACIKLFEPLIVGLDSLVGVTAIVDQSSRQHFYALSHSSQEPNFHNPKDWTPLHRLVSVTS